MFISDYLPTHRKLASMASSCSVISSTGKTVLFPSDLASANRCMSSTFARINGSKRSVSSRIGDSKVVPSPHLPTVLGAASFQAADVLVQERLWTLGVGLFSEGCPKRPDNTCPERRCEHPGGGGEDWVEQQRIMIALGIVS